jgi:hypothetical protein
MPFSDPFTIVIGYNFYMSNDSGGQRIRGMLLRRKDKKQFVRKKSCNFQMQLAEAIGKYEWHSCEGEGSRGAESYVRKKAWPSLNRSILSEYSLKRSLETAVVRAELLLPQ